MATNITSAAGLPFTNAHITDAINLIPNVYGMVNDLDLLPSEPTPFTMVQLDSEAGQIYAIPATSRGGPPTTAAKTTRRALFAEIPYIPHVDSILAADLQNLLEIGTRDLKTLDKELVKRLEQFNRPRHDVTREVMRMAALKGLVIDGGGQTIIDLFAEFNVTKTIVPLDLSNPASDVMGKVDLIFETIGANLQGSPMTGVECIVASDLFNALIRHAEVKATWQNYDAASRIANMNRVQNSMYGREFLFQNVLFREQKARAQRWDIATNRPASGTTPFVTAGFGHAYPVGTMNVGKTFDGPPDALSMVNRAPPEGGYIHVTQKPLDHDKGVELLSQSNCLPIWTQPKVLIEVKMGAS